MSVYDVELLHDEDRPHGHPVRVFTPGPVEIPARVLRALSQVPPHHRTDVFRAAVR